MKKLYLFITTIGMLAMSSIAHASIQLHFPEPTSNSHEMMYAWATSIVSDRPIILLTEGETDTVTFTISPAVSGPETTVSVIGSVLAENTSPVQTTMPTVALTLNGSETIPNSCEDDGGLVLGPFAEATCDYSITRGDDNPLSLVAQAFYGSTVVSSASRTINPGAAIVKKECVDSSDDLSGSPSQQFCADAVASYTVDYVVGPFSAPGECGFQDFDITAMLHDVQTSDEVASATLTVPVFVACPSQGIPACRLSDGQIKKEPLEGGVWDNLANGSNTPFFNSGMSYPDVFEESSAGNIYFRLAAAYITVLVNMLNDAHVSAEYFAYMNAAADIFRINTPEDIATLDQKDDLYNDMQELAASLNSYSASKAQGGSVPCDKSL